MHKAVPVIEDEGPKWIFPLEQSNQSMVHKEEKSQISQTENRFLIDV